MKRNLFILIYLIVCLLCPERAAAQEPTPQENVPDSIRISLLTCASGGEIYSLFGHTAIRYENFTRRIDAVFNYGVFSFNVPNFALRFALGETDYQLGVTEYERFAAEYSFLGRDVRQQTLNLTRKEKERLVSLLQENYRPENREYRYNFFYDNCATRPRDMIEKAIDGTLQYAGDMTGRETGLTYRDVLRKYCEGHPWASLGIDMCMGSKADRPISRREMMFVPFYVEEYFGTARIVDKAGEERPLVSSEEVIVETGLTAADHREEGITPLQAAWLLFALVTAATLCGIRYRKSLWVLDLVLFAAAGIAGCILAFMVLFSQHPAVSPNYLLFVFHPLHLFCLPWTIRSVMKRRKSRYMAANCVVLTLFILLWTIIPQRFDLAVLPLALCLLVRYSQAVRR